MKRSKSLASLVSEMSERATVARPDLARLGIIREILTQLNDMNAGADRLSGHVERFPALSARISLDYMLVRPGTKTLPGLREQITVIGNQRLEAVLFALLEDLTVLRSEIDHGEEARTA